MTAFDEFWLVYPRKVGKWAAHAAYMKALRQATPEQILEGVARYVRRKPSYADWCHPATFLNQGRWLDESDAPAADDWRCPHVPPCHNTTWCQVVRARARGEV